MLNGSKAIFKKNGNKVLFIDDKIETNDKMKKVEDELKIFDPKSKIVAAFGVFIFENVRGLTGTPIWWGGGGESGRR